MKQSFGAKPAKSCLLWMHWIVANRKREHTGTVLVAGNTCRPTDTTTNEPTDSLIYAIDAELDRDGQLFGRCIV